MYQKEELSRVLAQASVEKSRAEALRVQLRDLDAQIETLTAREAELARQRKKEQADVDALEGRGLTALFYAAIGRREEKLDREKVEAYQAAAHHDAARMQLASAQREREARQTELDRLGDVNARYEAAYRAKLDWLRQNDPVNGAEIARLEAEKLACDDRRREIAEALAAGRAANEQAMQMREILYDAQNLSAYNLWDNNLRARTKTYEKLAEAQRALEDLQKALSNFCTELSDIIEKQVDMSEILDGLLDFMDGFYDGLFADWTNFDRIQESRTKVKELYARIEELLQRLTQLDAAEQPRQRALQEQLDRLVASE